VFVIVVVNVLLPVVVNVLLPVFVFVLVNVLLPVFVFVDLVVLCFGDALVLPSFFGDGGFDAVLVALRRFTVSPLPSAIPGKVSVTSTLGLLELRYSDLDRQRRAFESNHGDPPASAQ
jgi:hypothetical protein